MDFIFYWQASCNWDAISQVSTSYRAVSTSYGSSCLGLQHGWTSAYLIKCPAFWPLFGLFLLIHLVLSIDTPLRNSVCSIFGYLLCFEVPIAYLIVDTIVGFIIAYLLIFITHDSVCTIVCMQDLCKTFSVVCVAILGPAYSRGTVSLNHELKNILNILRKAFNKSKSFPRANSILVSDLLYNILNFQWF